MNLMWFDSHAHITSLDSDVIDDVMQRAQLNQVKWVMNICTSNEDLEKARDYHQKYPQLFLAGATTPHDVEKQGPEFVFFEKAALSGELKAVGETGLDYHYEHSPKKLQQEYLLKYIDLALRSNLPLVIHCRDAFADLITTLDRYYLDKPGARDIILHCFTGSELEASALVEREVFLSFSGIVTFKNSFDLRSVIKQTPIENILVETDTPYLAPVPMRGKSNEPSFVPYIGKTIAAEKEMTIEQVAHITTLNAKRIFQIE